MWLDAFIPKSGSMQNSGVPGVPGVPVTNQASEYATFAKSGNGNTLKSAGVLGVPVSPLPTTGTPGTPRNTSLDKRCSNGENTPQANEYGVLPVCGTPRTPGTPQKQHKPLINDQTRQALAQFRFDLIQADIDAGHPVAELHRINNAAWEFMQVDGMGFKDAIALAAEIVVKGQVAACEAAYCDVMTLFQKVTDVKD
jgi:hypothetical protein